MSIGSRIKELREQLQISQIDLAVKIGVSKQSMYKYENGIITNIPYDKVEAMAKIFDVTPAYIMGWSEKDELLMSIGQRIKRRREELDMSQDELAKKLGYKSRSSVNKIEKDSRNLTQSRIKAIADALNTTPSYIMGWSEETNISEEIKYDNVYPIETRRFPLLGEIACGKPIFANEDRESYIKAGTEINADFCLRCKGDSMRDARILDGDIVFIRKQSSVDNGEIAAVIINDEATLKRVYFYPQSNKLVLNPANPSYEPLVFVGDELNQVRILGLAVAFQSDVK